MPWCPKCKTEYRRGYNICSDCGSSLVETLEVFKELEIDLADAGINEEWIFLVSCADDQEAMMIESFLTGENIILQKKYDGASEYLRITWGMTKLGVDLYVRKSQFDVAKEIINEVFGAENKADSKLDEGIIKNFRGTYWNKGRKRLFLVSIISLIFILSSIIVSTWSTLKLVFR
ncbi:MAG: DUF2007 domain-containing protein [Desulfitobacteriaceae bacterium]